jgi:hypothetical protein
MYAVHSNEIYMAWTRSVRVLVFHVSYFSVNPIGDHTHIKTVSFQTLYNSYMSTDS